MVFKKEHKCIEIGVQNTKKYTDFTNLNDN